jgi:hypothetical protein
MSNVVRRGNFVLPLEKILFGKDRGSVERRDEIEQPIFLFLLFSLWFASLFQMENFHMEKYKLAFRMHCSPKPNNTVGVGDFIHNNIEYNRIPTSFPRSRYTSSR